MQVAWGCGWPEHLAGEIGENPLRWNHAAASFMPHTYL
jgi:hypothetical protein